MGKKKKHNGIKAMVFGAALLGSGLTTFGTGVGMTIYRSGQPEFIQTIERLAEINEELNVPLHESNLYLNQNYEEEKSRISSLEEESFYLERRKELYYTPYENIAIPLLLLGLMAVPGYLILEKGHRKYKLSLRREERETAENQ